VVNLNRNQVVNLIGICRYMPNYKLQAQIKKEAEQIGEEKGVQKKAKEIAQQLKNKGFTVDQIIELTGISKAQATKLNPIAIGSEK